MGVELGLFDIMQIDPTDPASHADVYANRLDDLAFADELGFSIAFTAERHYLQHYRCPAPTAWIAAASQRTSKMRLGILAYTLPIHDPVRLAEEVAVLDHLTRGRLEVGLGLGHRKEELIALGVDSEQRIPIFQERITVMEALWTGGSVTLEGKSVTIQDIAINPLPMQEPHPPLWYAGVEAGEASWAGNHGMSLAVGFAPLQDLVPAAGGFRAGQRARAEFARQSQTDVSMGRLALMQHVYIAETDERAHQEMRDDLARLASLPGDDESENPENRNAKAETELQRLFQSHVFLAGSPQTVAQGIEFARKALGIDLFLANVYAAGVDRERIRRTMRLLATDVRAALDATGASAE